MKLNLKDQSSAHEKQRSTIKRNALPVRKRESRYLFLPLFPAVFKENISVFNFLFLEIVMSKFKFSEYIRKTSFDR